MTAEDVVKVGGLILTALALLGGGVKFLLLQKGGGADLVTALQRQVTQLSDDFDEERAARDRSEERHRREMDELRRQHRDEIDALTRANREEIDKLQREVRDLLSRPRQS